MHKAKVHLAMAAERLRGIERKKFLTASAIVIIFALVIVGGAIVISNALQTPPPVSSVILTGQISCLPHKNTASPQTMECALGLHSDENRYYALKNSPNTINSVIGRRVEVHGILTTTTGSIYDITGTIEVTSLTPQQ